MKIDDLISEAEVQQLDELKAGKYAQVASLLGALAAQHGGKAADAATVGYKQQAPHALATLATYADPKKLSALPATLSADELNKGEDEWKRQRDKLKIGRLIPSLKEGHVQRNGAAFQLFGLRLHFYRDHVFYIVKGGPDISIYRDGASTPRNDEIYVKDAAARGVPKDIIQVISYWLNTPDDKQQALLPRIEQALEHIAGTWLKQHAAKKEHAMRMEDLEEGLRPLSVQQLATISDEALDKAYGYGRSSPGNTFGWQANLKSAEFAKRMIDKGITDIEKISDAIHQGWNVTAKAFVQNPNQFDDTAKLQAAGKLEAKLQQREKLMKIGYNQLPDDEKEKDRVVARALLTAITGQQGVAEDEKRMSRAGKGVMKYGKDGMKALAKAGRDGASDEKLDKLRDKYDKYNEGTEPDHEASMAKGQLYNACKNAMELFKMIEDGENLEGWVAAKITKASDYLNSVHDYLVYEKKTMSEEKQRLDPKCWTGYRKSGTKMKGGVRVNNCVKVKK